MAQPIEKFTGASGTGTFFEFLTALSDEQYDAAQRRIALELLALDPADQEFDVLISSQDNSIQANLKGSLPALQKLYNATKTLKVMEDTMARFCDLSDDNPAHVFFLPKEEEDKSEEIIEALLPQESQERENVQALEGLLWNIDGRLGAVRGCLVQLSDENIELTRKNESLSQSLVELLEEVKRSAADRLLEPARLAEEVVAVDAQPGQDEGSSSLPAVTPPPAVEGLTNFVEKLAVVEAQFRQDEGSSSHRAITPPPAVEPSREDHSVSDAMLLSTAARLASPSRSPSKMGAVALRASNVLNMDGSPSVRLAAQGNRTGLQRLMNAF